MVVTEFDFCLLGNIGSFTNSQSELGILRQACSQCPAQPLFTKSDHPVQERLHVLEESTICQLSCFV